MELKCNPEVAMHLTERSQQTQRTRLITEDGFSRFGYCLRCTSNRLTRMRAGTVAQDFFCPKCGQPYELKSSARAHTRIVQDGGYESMMKAIRSESVPALMLMHYTPEWFVHGLIAIHPVFLTPAVVRKRAKPHIRPRSGRPYWMCDLDLTRIPSDGKILVVDKTSVRPEDEVRKAFRESMRFAEIPVKERGWTGLVLAAVRKIGKTEFTLEDVYAHEERMHAAYPRNSHVRPKIRQQLQALRDLGYLEFPERGRYRVLL